MVDVRMIIFGPKSGHFAHICQKYSKKSIFTTFSYVFCTCEKYVISAQPTHGKYTLRICLRCVSAHLKWAETLQSHQICQFWAGPKYHPPKSAKNGIDGQKTHHFHQNIWTSAHLNSAPKDMKCIKMCSPINFKHSIPVAGISKIRSFPASLSFFEK